MKLIKYLILLLFTPVVLSGQCVGNFENCIFECGVDGGIVSTCDNCTNTYSYPLKFYKRNANSFGIANSDPDSPFVFDLSETQFSSIIEARDFVANCASEHFCCDDGGGTGGNQLLQLVGDTLYITGGNSVVFDYAKELIDLSDVTSSDPTYRNVLIGDGTKFESRQIVMNDVTLSSLITRISLYSS